MAGFATLAVPAQIQAGTRDLPPGAPAPDGWRTHLAAYEAATPGHDRFALVLDGVDHYFGGIICRPELPGPKQQAGFDAALARSMQFLDGYGRGDRTAKAALVKGIAALGPVQLSRK